MSQIDSIDAIIVGNIDFETIINTEGAITLANPGGSALYAASGFRLSGKTPGIISKISENRSRRWMRAYQDAGCDTTGISKVIGEFGQSRFYAISEDGRVSMDNPQKYFFNLNQPLPKFLLGYEPPQVSNDINRAIQPSSITPQDIPEEYLKINHLLVAPMDVYSHNMIPPFYRSRTDGRVLFCGSRSFMQPAFWYEFPPMIRGAGAFITSLTQLKRLFLGKTQDPWEMVEFIADAGVEIITVFAMDEMHMLYDAAARKKYRVPRINSEMVDPIGVFPTFFGAFCGGFITHFDPLESALMASVAASIKQEGSGPLYTLQTLPDLARARLESLRNDVKIA